MCLSSEASDGRQDLYQAQKEAFEPILAQEPGWHLQVNTEKAEQDCRDETLERLLRALRGEAQNIEIRSPKFETNFK